MEILILINLLLSTLMPLQTIMMKEETGWLKTTSGTYYIKETKPLKGLQVINNETYYFNNNGVMQTGVQNTPEERYFDETGRLTEGIQEVDGKLMLYTKDGLAQTGWYDIDGTRYYVSQGIIQTGEQVIKDKEYLFDDAGRMQTGWHNNRYYGKEGYAESGEVEIDGHTCYLQADGTLYTGLMNDMYYNEDGSVYKGDMWLEDLFISTDENGKINYKATRLGMETAQRAKKLTNDNLQDYIREVYAPYTTDLKSGSYSADPMPGDLVVFKDEEDYRILAGIYTGYGKMQTNKGEESINTQDGSFVGYLRLTFLEQLQP